jgi:hypothetical protein
VLGRRREAAKDGEITHLGQEFEAIAKRWSEQNGIEIHLEPEALELLCRKAREDERSPQDVFSTTFKNYEHGLSLIRKSRGVNRFEITADVVKNPAGTLDSWIRDFYVSREGA